jgi:hypothetical protein
VRRERGRPLLRCHTLTFSPSLHPARPAPGRSVLRYFARTADHEGMSVKFMSEIIEHWTPDRVIPYDQLPSGVECRLPAWLDKPFARRLHSPAMLIELRRPVWEMAGIAGGDGK